MDEDDEDDIIAHPPPGSRHDDTWSAKEAEKLFLSERETGRLRMLRVFYRAGENGLTADEAAWAAEMQRGCYWKRVSEIRQMGLIGYTGKSRKGSQGVNQSVSVITGEGKRLYERRVAAGRDEF